MAEAEAVAAPRPSGWTIETLKEHYDALRVLDEKLRDESDRRISEGATLRERALNVKEVADKEALALSRENQQYKDEKADKARDQSLTERGAYVTRDDLELVVNEIKSSLRPLFDFVASWKGADKATFDADKASSDTRTNSRLDSTLLISAGMAVVGVIGLVVTIVTLFAR